MVIETGRLRIVPLDADMLETLSRDVKEFEREYDAKIRRRKHKRRIEKHTRTVRGRSKGRRG